MDTLAPSEHGMWEKRPPIVTAGFSDREINEKYDSREQRIVTESNREKLPNFVAALKTPGYMKLRPFYQRRPRWDPARQSRLIESFIINIPVPPVFLYEQAYNSYEVMDGQQRISAIQEFYDNRLVLKGLELWPELNGRTYATLPSKIRAGVDRRSLSSIVLVKESADTEEEAMLIKQLVFERLNTGGVKLSKQEIRNSLYQGLLNDLTLKLSRDKIFAQAWNVPTIYEDFINDPPPKLLKNTLYQTMGDVELVLRFFALRHVDHFRRGIQGFLDLYVIRARSFSEEDIRFLQDLFEATLHLAYDIYKDIIFRPFDPRSNKWSKQPHVGFYDSVMIGLSRNLDQASIIRRKKEEVIEGTKNLFIRLPEGTFTGRGNTKADLSTRINLYSDMITSIIQNN
jgi:hypothetical protein